jgi:hypothetical protein
MGMHMHMPRIAPHIISAILLAAAIEVILLCMIRTPFFENLKIL